LYKKAFITALLIIAAIRHAQELQSSGAYNRFLENTLAQARMRMHMR